MERSAGRRVQQKRRGERAALGEREKRRLIQLGACLILFMAVFFAKGMDRLKGFQGELANALRSNTDFRTAFANLGWSVASGRPVGETLNDLWVDVFFAQEKAETGSTVSGPLSLAVQREYLKINPAQSVLLEGPGRMEGTKDPMAESGVKKEPAGSEPQTEAEPAVITMEYSGPALPDNTTMDRYALEVGETVTPALGVLTSGFGWREHPIEGEEKFHYGVDLGMETGTPVQAFAAGTVDYIGESEVYGQYLQLRHDNGVTSFYAHCSKLCVQQGQAVAAGEKVAESGATGEVTGPHLHFELKKNAVRLNPAYYIETRP